MARELYPGVLVEYPDGTNALSAPVRLFTDLTSGVEVTADVVGPDGVSAWVAVTDEQGLLSAFRGPDGHRGPLFIDTGADLRFMVLSSTVQTWLVDNVAALIAGGVTTDGGSTGGTTTTVNLAGYAVVIHGATSQRINPATGTPLAAGTSVIWVADSLPTHYAENIDIWLNRP